jgi:hypothetical protein
VPNQGKFQIVVVALTSDGHLDLTSSTISKLVGTATFDARGCSPPPSTIAQTVSAEGLVAAALTT